MNAPLHFGKVALRGSVVTGISQGVRVGLQFLSVVILARLLVPEDFGLVAAVGPIVAFVGLFQNLGLQQAVVQRMEITDAQLNRMFWIMAAVGLACTTVVVLISPAVAWFYGDPRMRGITILAGLPLLLGSMAGLPLSLLNRHLRFGQLALIDMANALVGFLAAAASAYLGMGYWSLLVGSAASAAVSLAVGWWWSHWTPGRPDFAIDRDIMSFGANLTGFNLVNFFSRNLDNILIGKFSGAVELGFYDRAYKLLLFPIQNIIAPLSRVMIPLLARVQNDKARFRDLYLQIVWVLSFVTVPGVAALVCTSEQVVTILFGEKWQAVAPIFAWLGLAGLVQAAGNTTGWVFMCQGKTKTMFQWGVYAAATTIAAFVIGLPWGAVGVAAAYAISTYALRIPVLTWLMHRVGPVSAYDFLMAQFLYVFSSLATWAIFNFFPDAFVRSSNLVTVILVTALSYLLAGLITLAVPEPRRVAFVIGKKVIGAIR
ncbi:lipopolysaccharide biosynthesis protein [Mesorhizobium sp. BAC0120]|uniref:lipopolysaccharide biosynthesis protein n=1 Tax=Mesorhizobium sp. BAC0120 TaxID=3090670 RepID=UPI00298BDCB8|nr:lipopolysaccharide biosynthesis protein [Mesorhizobium sp. BAC0120]MDW6022556.1 lipopolysaccharide biosynthesis protein [Mesorhizobium sp. BAC0120]